MEPFDFHTHDPGAAPGRAIVSLPRDVVARPDTFAPRPGVLYSAGVHPWWTDADTDTLLAGVARLVTHPQVVALGECGLDRLRGAPLPVQTALLERQAALAERHALPLTIHCVRAFDVLLGCVRRLRPATRWTVHGFRGRAALARQLLDAGLDLSFGPRFSPDSLRLTPPSRRHAETDDSGLALRDVLLRQREALENA